jgi:hypothetical protein
MVHLRPDVHGTLDSARCVADDGFSAAPRAGRWHEQHVATVGSERFRIVYDSAFTWPDNDGSAKMYLPIPPETGGQHITSFTSSIKGAVETDDNGHRMIVATVHPGGSRRVHWRVVITGTWKIRQLEDGATAAADPVASGGGFLGTSASINWKDAAFQDWLDETGLRRHSGEAAVDFAQRVYNYLHTHGAYTYPPVSAWTTAACARRLRTDCGGFSLVFTARAGRTISRRGCWWANASRSGAPATARR